MTFQITHVLRGGKYGIETGWCVLSLATIDALKDKYTTDQAGMPK